LIREEGADIQEVKDKISEVMATAFDYSTELGGMEKDKEAIDQCHKLSQNARHAKKRYRYQSILITLTIQILVIITTALSVYVVYCEGPEDYKICILLPGKRLKLAFGILLPICATALQAMETTLRPRKKYANLLLAQKMFESETFKFRARIGIYSAFDHTKAREDNNARKIFMEKCNRIYEECLQTEVQFGTMHTNWACLRKIRSCFRVPKTCTVSCFRKTVSCLRASKTCIVYILLKPDGRNKWREEKLRQKVEAAVKSNFDLEAQADNPDNKPIYRKNISKQEKRLLERLNEAENDRENHLTKMNKEKEAHKYCILSIDEYVAMRLKPTYKRYTYLLPRLVFFRNILLILIILFTAATTFLVAMGWDLLIPVALSFAAAARSVLHFFQLEVRCPTLHTALAELKKIELITKGNGILERRLPSKKREMIERIEEAILSNYNHLAESALEYVRAEEGLRRDKAKKED